MKFIFPQNYKYNNKILGILDYSTAIFNLIWYLFIYFILNIFNFSIGCNIFLFIFFCFPIFLFSLFYCSTESILYIFFYMFIFLKNRKVYLYM